MCDGLFVCGVLSQKEMRNFSFICDGVVLISAFFSRRHRGEGNEKEESPKNRNDGGRWVGERVATLVRIDD